jgi:hypothetical protein
MDPWLPGQTKTFGRAAIGHDRPNPLLRSDLVMDNAPDANKADKTGVYKVVDDSGTETHQYFKEGDFLPANAEWRGERDEDAVKSPRQAERERIAGMTEERAAAETEAEPAPQPEERARGAAPQNRAKSAPDNR